MQSRIIITLLFTVVSFVAFSQAPASYHRLYQTNLGRNNDIQEDTVFYHMSSATISGTVTAMGTKRIADENLTLVFTNHDNKGDLSWSTEFDLGQDTVTILGVGEMDINEAKDSIIFTIDAEINGTARQLYGRMTTAGDGLVLQTVGGNEFATLGSIPKVANFFNQSNLLVTQGDRPTISRVGPGDELKWSRTYEFLNGDGDQLTRSINDIKMTPDSTIIIAIENDLQDARTFGLAELDSNGVQIWAESYSFDSGVAIERITPHEICPLEGGDIAIVGELSLDFGDPIQGFIMVVDTAGVTQFSKIVSATSENNPGIILNGSLRNVIQAADRSIWASGLYTEDDTTRYFMTNFDMEGNQNWTTRYGDDLTDDDAFTTSVFNVDMTGGVTLVGQGFLEEVKVLNVVQHDEMGSARCSDTLAIMIQDINMLEDTLITDVVNGGLFFEDIDFEATGFSGFSPPMLTVEGNFMFCPNEDIDTILIASVSGVGDSVLTFQWADADGEIAGATNDTLQVFEEGQYSVFVTVDDAVCFIQCDTVMLTRIPVPVANIGIVDNSRCENGGVVFEFDLIGGVEGGRLPYSYSWSTLENGEVITVSELGTYMVTVTDDCGETSSATIIVEEPTFNPQIIFNVDQEDFCETMLTDITALYSGGGEVVSYLWSTGEDTQMISVSEEGDFSVTITDNCGFVTTATISVEEPTFNPQVVLSLNETQFCQNGSSALIASYSGGGSDPVFEWSTGETTTQNGEPTSSEVINSAIQITEPGEYSVTVTDECGLEVSATGNFEVRVLATEAEIMVEIDCNEEDIELSEVTISATGTEGADIFLVTQIIDEDGNATNASNDNPTTNLGLGNYRIFANDFCGNILDSTTINTISSCGGFVQYPTIFFPSGNEDSERVFGPIPSDTMDLDRITDVEFKVFNRWGETVFESTEILDAWDGSHKGEPAPSEVYIWYVSYLLDGEEMLDKGDITLVR